MIDLNLPSVNRGKLVYIKKRHIILNEPLSGVVYISIQQWTGLRQLLLIYGKNEILL